MPKLDRVGGQIYYEVHGEGPVILLSHGYSATSDMWRGQVEPLSKTLKLVIWDMHGHGHSDYPDDPAAYSEALTVANMAALLVLADRRRPLNSGGRRERQTRPQRRRLSAQHGSGERSDRPGTAATIERGAEAGLVGAGVRATRRPDGGRAADGQAGED